MRQDDLIELVSIGVEDVIKSAGFRKVLVEIVEDAVGGIISAELGSVKRALQESRNGFAPQGSYSAYSNGAQSAPYGPPVVTHPAPQPMPARPGPVPGPNVPAAQGQPQNPAHQYTQRPAAQRLQKIDAGPMLRKASETATPERLSLMT